MDGFVADAEFFGDFLVDQALCEQVEHLLFAFGKIFGGGGRGRRALEGLDDFARDVRGHRRAAAMDFADGFEQFLAGTALEHVAVRAGGERVENIFRVFIDREHHHLEAGQRGFQLPDAIHAVHAGQVDVHQDDFGPGLGQVGERVLGAGVVAGATEAVRALDHAGKRRAQLVVVLDDGNGNGHWVLVLIVVDGNFQPHDRPAAKSFEEGVSQDMAGAACEKYLVR